MSSDRTVGDRDGTSTATATAMSVSSEAYEVLSAPRRAVAVAVLVDRRGRDRGPISTAELATRVAAREAEKPVAAVTDEEYRAVLVSLHHHHLPKLSAHRILEWDADADEVRFADDAALSPAQFSSLFDDRSVVRPNRLFRTLAQSRRRLVVSILSAHDGPLSVDELARRVVAREKAASPGDVAATDVDRVCVSLHHSHLPALASVGLVTYDPEAGLVGSRTRS